MRFLICGIFTKGYKWTYLQNRNRLTDFEKLLVIKGSRLRGGWTGCVWIGICTLLYMEWLASGEPAVCHREFNSIFCDNVGKESKENGCGYLYNESLFATVAETRAAERGKLHLEMQNSQAFSAQDAGSEKWPLESEPQVFVLGSFYTIQTLQTSRSCFSCPSSLALPLSWADSVPKKLSKQGYKSETDKECWVSSSAIKDIRYIVATRLQEGWYVDSRGSWQALSCFFSQEVVSLVTTLTSFPQILSHHCKSTMLK